MRRALLLFTKITNFNINFNISHFITPKTLCEVEIKIMLKFNPISANPTKWSNTPKQFVGNLPANYLNLFDHFMGLGFKGLKNSCFDASNTRNKMFKSIQLSWQTETCFK